MARFSRLQTLTRMKSLGLVPIFNTPDVSLAASILTAANEAGAAVMEFTNRGDGALEVFKQISAFCAANLPDMILGAGSIIDAPTAALYIAAGADFIVSPVLDEPTAVLCNGRKIPYIPGCGTLSEMHKAHLLGVEFCKFFPADCLGGPEFIKAVRAPMPWTEVIAMGGIAPTAESLGSWFDAGAACVGMSSKLFTKECLEKRDFGAITEKIKQTLRIIRDVRKQ